MTSLTEPFHNMKPSTRVQVYSLTAQECECMLSKNSLKLGAKGNKAFAHAEMVKECTANQREIESHWSATNIQMLLIFR